jgi:ABC-type branched-subunit amino acid transport system substrate-binding protein
MPKRPLKNLIALSLSVLCLSCGGGGGGGGGSTPEPLKIGVLLPLTGEDNLGWKKVLDWAAEDINEAGPVAGRKIELVYADTAVEGVSDASNRLLADTGIKAFIGPNTSAEMDDVASRFIRKKQVLVTPSATSEDIFKAFGGKKYIWRTVESDTAQLEVMFALAKTRGARTAALITSWDSYGSTFFNWFGFLAYEAGVEPTGIARYESGSTECQPSLDKALASGPDVLFAVALHADMVACIENYAGEISPDTRVIFSDGALTPEVLTTMGPGAEGLEGVIPAEDPDSGFKAAYEARFGSHPSPFAANVYDALLLLSYGLEGSNGEGGEALADSMIRVTDASGEPKIEWGKENIRTALDAIASGDIPDLAGASGPFDYDLEYHTDPLMNYYTHWVVENGVFVEKDFYSTGDGRDYGAGAVNRNASESLRQVFNPTPGPSEPRTGLWALIVAGSNEWGNYRHQSDALAQYQLLKKSGLGDDRIILVLADDIAGNEANPYPGVVQYVDGGENMYEGVQIDYNLSEITATALLDILSGKQSETLDQVILSGPGDNIYVYLSGHGNQNGFFVDSPDPLSYSQGALLTPQALNTALKSMNASDRYRQVLLVVEACHSGALGQTLNAPNALMLTAANPYENSLAANRREIDGVWLADQFSYEFWRASNENSSMTIMESYLWTYERVSGSHVTLYNHQNFEGVATVELKSFIAQD